MNARILALSTAAIVVLVAGAVLLFEGVQSRSLSVVTVPVAANPTAVAVAARTARAFVASRGQLDGLGNPVGPGTVTVIRLPGGAVERRVQVGADPTAVAIDEQRGRVFVLSGGRIDASGRQVGHGSLAVLDAATGRLLESMPVGIAARVIALERAHRRALVVNAGAPPRRGSITILDANTKIQQIRELRTGVYPTAIAVDPPRGRAYVANFVSNTVSVIATTQARLTRTIRLGPSPGTLADVVVAPAAGTFVTLSYPPRLAGGGGPELGEIAVIDADTHSIVLRIALQSPVALVADPGRSRIYVAQQTTLGGRLVALDARSGERLWTARLASEPADVVVERGTSRLLVLERATVTVLDRSSGRQRAEIRLPKSTATRFSNLALDSRHDRLLLTAGKPAAVLIVPLM